MPTNNFKLFDEKKANMMTDEEYAINQQRLNGVQSGVASSQLQNKTLYQTALMCYALAQLMAANGYDANDANAVSTFVNNLSLSMVQKVVDKASANDVANQVAGKWVDAKQLGELKANIADNYLSLLGGTMLGDLILHSDPTQSLQAATKQYVDKFCRIATGSYAGTGTYGKSNPTVINCGFKPKYVYVYNLATARESSTSPYSLRFIGYDNINGGDHDDTNAFLFIDALPKSIILCTYPAVVTLNIEFNETGISFYVTTENIEQTQYFLPEAQLNRASSRHSNKYYYVAIG